MNNSFKNVYACFLMMALIACSGSSMHEDEIRAQVEKKLKIKVSGVSICDDNRRVNIDFKRSIEGSCERYSLFVGKPVEGQADSYRRWRDETKQVPGNPAAGFAGGFLIGYSGGSGPVGGVGIGLVAGSGPTTTHKEVIEEDRGERDFLSQQQDEAREIKTVVKSVLNRSRLSK
ncbi:MAG: hypothetical protein PHY92_07960 [Alphaproteobacteria bacterium]|nr:hypothetical protein [Alphaproteobacteria bacterium]